MNRKLPTRQVHLDFHTSQHMPGVGSKFDKEHFQKALKIGKVNSMTIFAKGHHGYCYYPTKVGDVHPTLMDGFDLTGAMIDACHEVGVFAPIYITLGWSALDAENHPQWLAKNKDGVPRGYVPHRSVDETRPDCSWLDLCSAGGYREYLNELTEEICQRYKNVDGLF